MSGPKAEQGQCLILQTKSLPLIIFEVSWHWAGLREGKGSPHCEGLNTEEIGCNVKEVNDFVVIFWPIISFSSWAF